MGHGDTLGDIEERRRVLIHASSLNRADVIKKVLRQEQSESSHVGDSPPSSGGWDEAVDRDVLDHVDEKGLTALHHAVRKSSLDAIRVLLRLGVDVTARAGQQSIFPDLTAYQVALAGECKGDPEEIKQAFLTEAVQAIARGDSDRLQAFLHAGLEASSEYGRDGGNGDNTASLSEWAEQLGRSAMLSALSPRPNQGNEASPAKGGGDRKHGAEASEERAAEATAAAGSGVKSDGGGGGDGAPDDAGLFVEELRDAIVDLTTECEELEAVLSPQGTLGIIKRARSVNQELMLAEKEVETAKALCERWRVAEEAAVATNARLQAKVVEAQAAVHRHRTGVDNDNDSVDDSGTDKAAAANPEVSHANHEEPSSASGTATGRLNDATAKASDGQMISPEEGGDGGEESAAAGVDPAGKGGTDAVESRRQEESAALSLHLQAIAMHLEDELRMMRALANGNGLGTVVSRIRALREDTEASEEEARQTYSVSRYLEARVIILVDNGDELRSQLSRLESYLRQPRDAAAASSSSTGTGTAANGDPERETLAPPGKEDVDSLSAALEHGYRGPVLDAFLGGEEEGGTPLRDRRDIRGRAEGGQEADENDASISGGGDYTIDPQRTAGAVAAAAAGEPAPGAVEPENLKVVGGSVAVGAGNDIDIHRDGDVDGGGVGGAGGGATARGSGTGSHSSRDATETTATAERSEAAEASGGREGRARALLSAPGVDAANGVRGWRRARRGAPGAGGGVEGGAGGGGEGDVPKVTVVQDVLSVLFGWGVSDGGKGSVGAGGVGGKAGRGSPGAGVLFA